MALPQPAVAAVAGLFGLAIGSFLNVLVYRLPLHESLVRPGSRCPACGHAVRPYDNVPVLSWLVLRGRCRDCQASISPRYALIEAATAALWVAVVLAKGRASEVALGLLLVAVLLPVAAIDFDHRVIPNRVLAPAALAAIAIEALVDPAGLGEHLLAAAGAGGFLLVAVVAYPRGMGMGDVKLAAVLGLFLGAPVAVAMLAALLSGTVVGVAIIASRGAAAGRKTAIPFGPFLALGAVVALFVGQPLLDTYLKTFS